MVLDFGDGQVQRGWGVEEKIAPGFSRVYWVQGGEVCMKMTGHPKGCDIITCTIPIRLLLPDASQS
ncbi:MAG: hypothetical protein ACLTDS_02790 [Bianqueaceae bacterium]